MPKSVLAIDDEARVCKVLSEVLSRNGYEVFMADSALDGLHILQDHEVDLIMLDINMPGVDGYETYESIRHNADTSSIPILFLTAVRDSFAADNETAKKLWEDHFGEGTTDILYKPVAVEDLLTKVGAMIGPPE